MTTSHLVFVYGTLKRNEPNHYVLENGLEDSNKVGFLPAKFKSEATTKLKYPLVIASKFNIPYLLDKQGTGNQIKGEIYEVNENMLNILDEFEGHPDYYQRRKEPILANSETLLCWAYFLPKFKPEMLEEPFLSDYKSLGDHGKPYSPEDDIEDINDI